MRCENCTHLASIHLDEQGHCRLTGCTCEAMVKPQEPEGPAAPRRICIDLPDGYTVSVSLIPWTAAAAAEAVAEEPSDG